MTFSVYDPNAGITYNLPVQSNGQLNMQNVVTGRDTLVFNGNTNFLTPGLSNYQGTNHWLSTAVTQNAALGVNANNGSNNNANNGSNTGNSGSLSSLAAQANALYTLGNLSAAMAPSVLQATVMQQQTSVDVGEVDIGELTDVICDPKKDERCRID